MSIEFSLILSGWSIIQQAQGNFIQSVAIKTALLQAGLNNPKIT